MTEDKLRTELEPLLAKLNQIDSDDIGAGLARNWHRNPEGPKAADTIEGLLLRIESLREAREADYRQGFRDGFVSAHVNDVDGFPDEEAVLRKVDSVAMAEGWEAYCG